MNEKNQLKLLYEQEQLPIFQNRMYDTESEARACPKGDMRLVEDQALVLFIMRSFVLS